MEPWNVLRIFGLAMLASVVSLVAGRTLAGILFAIACSSLTLAMLTVTRRP